MSGTVHMPVGADEARANVAALREALVARRVEVDAGPGRVAAEIVLQGHGPQGPARIVLERVDGPRQPWTEKAYLIGPDGVVGCHPWAQDLGHTSERRMIRHGQVDVADLFSPEGDASLSGALALVREAFGLLREVTADARAGTAA